jgi:hypothetical protein
MAESDPLIERTEAAAGISGTRAAQAANLFDLRRIIGAVFLVWGVVLTILGVTESDAEIAKAADVNINLWAGLGMLVLSGLFLLWAFTRPLGEELREAAASVRSIRGSDSAMVRSYQRTMVRMAAPASVVNPSSLGDSHQRSRIWPLGSTFAMP